MCDDIVSALGNKGYRVGLGAKSPLAYTNQFFIDTYTIEDGKNIHRSWVQYIDSSKIGKISLLEEGTFEGSTGTQIKIPIKLTDLGNIKDHINTYLSYSVLPYEVEGFEFEDTRPELNILGDDWGILLDKDRYYFRGNSYKSSTIVVAGIPYRINKKALNTKFQNNDYSTTIKHKIENKAGIKNNIELFNKFITVSFHLEYVFTASIGSVDLSASREDLQYTDRTCCYLYSQIFKMYQEFCTHLEIDFVNNPSYINACYNYSFNTSPVIKECLLNEMKWGKEKLDLCYRPLLFRPGKTEYIKKYFIIEQGSTFNNNLKVVLKSEEVTRVEVNINSNNTVFILQDTDYTNYTRFIKEYLCRVKDDSYVAYVVEYDQVPKLNSWVTETIELLPLSKIVSDYKEYAAKNKTKKKRDTSVFNAYVYCNREARSKADGYAKYFDSSKAPTKPHKPHYYLTHDELYELRNEGIDLPNYSYNNSFNSFLTPYLRNKGIEINQVWFMNKLSKHVSHENWFSLAEVIKEDFNNINLRKFKEHCKTLYLSKKIPTEMPFFKNLTPIKLENNNLYVRLYNQFINYYKEANPKNSPYNSIARLTINSYRILTNIGHSNLNIRIEDDLIEDNLIDKDCEVLQEYVDFANNYPLLYTITSYGNFEYITKENYCDYIYARSLVLKDSNKKITCEKEPKGDSEYKLMMNYFN